MREQMRQEGAAARIIREERYWLKQALDGARASLEVRYKAYAMLEELGLSEALDYVRQWREAT